MKRRWIGLACVLALAAFAPACAKRKQRREEVRLLSTAEETFDYAMRALEAREFRRAKQYFQRVEFSADNRRGLEPLVRLAIADLTYYQGDQMSLIEARSLYQDFVTLYADHPMAAYAQLQTGLCSLAQVNHPSRDQSQTHVAIDELRGVGERFPESPYAPIARLKVREAEERLAEHEFLVGRFYVKKKAYQAGVDRFRNILRDYPDFGEKDKVYYWLGHTMVARQGNLAEGRLYLETLIEDYPTSEWIDDARETLAEASVAAPEGDAGASS